MFPSSGSIDNNPQWGGCGGGGGNGGGVGVGCGVGRVGVVWWG